MLFRFKPTYHVSLTKLILALTCLMDYISKCDNVVLVVIKEIAPSKNTFVFKACVRYFLIKFLPNDSPSKTVKNVFYFI